jgi:roadblock/LC7 domain-containing protein
MYILKMLIILILSVNFQLKNYKSFPTIVHGACGNTTFPLDTDVPLINSKFQQLNEAFNMTQDDAEKLEKFTVDQSGNALWYEERKKRVTASQFARICKRKKDITDTFVSSIFESKNFTTEATSYGKCNENIAKQKYMEKFHNVHIHDCGLVVNPRFSFLAASPDGKVCIEGQTGVLEIKCPFSARDLLIAEAVNLPKFCLEILGDSYTLKKNHDYYFQIQGQLMVTGVSFCIFVVYTRKDLFVEKITKNVDFITEMFDKLANFYLQYRPRILNNIPAA